MARVRQQILIRRRLKIKTTHKARSFLKGFKSLAPKTAPFPKANKEITEIWGQSKEKQ